MMGERSPEIAGRGVIIDPSDPYPEVRRNAEGARDWLYQEEARNLYRMASLFKARFLDPVLLTDRARLPDPVISFQNLRNKNILAAYTLIRNPQGLLYEITLNTEQYEQKKEDDRTTISWRFGKWAQLETLLHEQVHLWQQNFGKDPVRPGRVYHNREFVNKCESLGLHPMPGVGCHTRLADGVFEQLMHELGIQRPDLTRKPDDLKDNWFEWRMKDLGKERKGRSSLKKWTCPECGLNVRIGIKGDPQLRHEPCEQSTGRKVFFIGADQLNQVIYKDPKTTDKK